MHMQYSVPPVSLHAVPDANQNPGKTVQKSEALSLSLSASGNRTPATSVKARDPNLWTNADDLVKSIVLHGICVAAD